MMDVKLTSSSANAVNMLGNIPHEFQRAIRQGWFRSGDELSKELNEQTLKKPRAGRSYVRKVRGGSRRRHRASRAGETPANQSGTYRKSRGYNIRGWKQLEWGVKDPKAKFLEEGTKNMQARPGVRNTVDAKQNQVQSILESELRKAFIR